MMPLIPEFELGVYNAWILLLSFFVFCTGLPPSIARVFTTDKNLKDSDEPSSFEEQEKKLQNLFIVALAASVIYSIFLPLKLGTAWFYVGVSIYLLGMLFNIVAEMNFRTTSIDKPVTKGVYRISRNPQLFGAFLAFIGISVACASWLFLLFTLAMIAAYNILVVSEERWCLEKYGIAYREYMNSTPKWIGIPKSKKRD